MAVEYRKRYGINFRDLTMEREIPEILSGQDVADKVEKVFDKILPDLASGLIESNVVLTMAALKPSSDFFVDLKSVEDAKRLEAEVAKLNELLNDKLINFRTGGKPFIAASDKRLTLMLGVDNLVGWERMTKTTKISGVPKFDHKLGWEGFEKWYPSFVKSVKKAQQMGEIPAKYEVIGGLMHGYPDQAIYDFEDWRNTGKKKKMVESQIPYTGTYKEAEPNYDFSPEHANDPQIQENIKIAGKVLEGFYKSKWHKKVAKSLKKETR